MRGSMDVDYDDRYKHDTAHAACRLRCLRLSNVIDTLPFRRLLRIVCSQPGRLSYDDGPFQSDVDRVRHILSLQPVHQCRSMMLDRFSHDPKDRSGVFTRITLCAELQNAQLGRRQAFWLLIHDSFRDRTFQMIGKYNDSIHSGCPQPSIFLEFSNIEAP